MREEILTLFNNCLDKGLIPSQFELAYLYPIPKPQWWNYDINLTRPIILLDCIRKLMVKIINNRLNHYLSNNQILQHNNQAGIQGASCNEIILQIQAIIDYQHDTKNLFFLALQDLSKAYDRVDLNLLQLALKRINIPDRLITFIDKLFSHHRNRIIFPFGYGSEYTTTNGIIQGEVISPLLWVIYYDLMFVAINNSPYQGYNLYASIPRNIFQNDDLHEKSINIKLLGYLDDTTWFAQNLDDLQNNLAIADDFYVLANIKINKDKTKILTNDKQINKKQQIPLKFGEDLVNIKIVPPSDNERILGIYINTNNKFTYTINKINRMLKFTCSNLRKKKITHDHIIYVINKVLIPRIEYLCQHFILLPHICNNFNRTIRSIYKSSLLLPHSRELNF